MSEALRKLYKPDVRLDKYENEAYTKNPLLNFRISQVRARRHHDLLKAKAASVRFVFDDQKIYYFINKIHFKLSVVLDKN